jgi:PAS domain-containing protein
MDGKLNRESAVRAQRGNRVADDVDIPSSKQTSFRLRADLYEQFQSTLREHKRKMNPVLQELVEDWLDRRLNRRKSSRSAFVGPYLSWLPVVALVKDPQGRVLFGNGEFLNLIGPGPHSENLLGKRAQNYVRDAKSAQIIDELDEAVRREGRPLLCVEHLSFEGKARHRIAIRFPIPPDGDLELMGVLGFDQEKVEKAILGTEFMQRRFCDFPVHPIRPPEAFSHCLKDFLHSLPAIATIKDLDGRVLCVNEEYTRVLGKRRREVEGLLSEQIWGQSFADMVFRNDEFVRRFQQTFISVERVPTRIGVRDRLNFRFPIFDAQNNLEMTGTLGFDYQLLIQGIQKLKASRHAASAFLFLQPADHPIHAEDPERLKLVHFVR